MAHGSPTHLTLVSNGAAAASASERSKYFLGNSVRSRHVKKRVLFSRYTLRLPGLLIAAMGAVTLLFSASSAIAGIGICWDADGTYPYGGTGTWNITNSHWYDDLSLSYKPWVNANNDTAIFGTASGTVTLGTGITVGGLTFNDSAGYVITGDTLTFGTAGSITANVDATISSVLDGTVGLAKAGAGTLTLSGANTYTGVTTISAGTLTLGNSSALGDTNNALAVSGGAVVEIGTYFPTVGAVTLTSGTIAGTGILTFNDTATLESGTVSANLAGVVIPINKEGPGTVTLSGNNSGFSGFININAGTLSVGDTNNLGDGSFSNALMITGTLKVTGDIVSPVDRSITLSGTPTIDVDSGKQLTIDGTVSSVGGGTLNKAGAGAVILSGPNAYTGGTTIGAGILQANNATALGTVGNITFGGGTLQYTAASAGQDWAARFKNSTSAAIALDTNLQNVTLAGVIDSSNTAGLTKTGAGTLSLTGVNTYTGGTVVTGGTLSINGRYAVNNRNITLDGAVLKATWGSTNSWSVPQITLGPNGGTYTASGYSNWDNDITGTGNFTLSSGQDERFTRAAGYSLTGDFIALSFSMNGGFGPLPNSTLDLRIAGKMNSGIFGGLKGSGNANLQGNTVQIGNNNKDTAYSGILSNGGLTKTGTGKLTLTNTNTYTGATSVTAGTLLINGSTHASSAVSVANNVDSTTATLGGIGTINGSVTVNATAATSRVNRITGATIGTTGTLNIGGGLTFGAGAIGYFDITSTSVKDYLNVTGNLTADSGTIIEVSTGLPGGEYGLIGYTGSASDIGNYL
ncbi:MAG: autotransporter-associated beta strand repeat-containing protein, partial [Planctomycetota bacterium]|nr:autotransporter-associated beta strand repeat-containing protein [Planctomycetota bacterium]